jgi:SAM-dependent methyltransferase
LQDDKIESYGLELNSEAVKVCKQRGLNVYNELLEDHNLNNSNTYDFVCSFQVLEHIPNPASYIQGCIDAVKKGGRIVFGVPNNNPFIFKRDKFHTLNLPPHHMGLWSKEAFDNLPKYFSLEKIEIYIEPLHLKRYYFEIFLKANGLGRFVKFLKKIPDRAVNKIASLRKWQGRNLLAVFKKI